jgi:two-component system OmpR family response regulator
MPDRRAQRADEQLVRRSRVLVLEDEAALCDVVVSALRLAGFDASGSGNGDDALVQRDELLPDLLLIDVTVPGLSGLDVCRAVRSRGDRTPIIFLTARDSLQDAVTFELGRRLPGQAIQPRGWWRVRAVLARSGPEVRVHRARTPTST